MISGLILVIIIEGLLTGSDLTPLNTAIESVVVRVRTPILTTFLVWVARIFNPFVMSSVAVLISAWLVLRRNYYDSALLLTSLLLAVVSLTILKNLFQITRAVSPLYVADGWSFPSGHATMATTFFFLLSHIFFSQMRTVGRKTTLILGSVFATALICFSRLYLGAHWTLDILGGTALGLLSVSFTILMFNIFLSEKRSLRRIMNL